MMPAAKQFDLIMGIDVHIVVTPPAPPIPTPHPFIGMVLDPTEFLPVVGATVWVNGMPSGKAGSSGSNKPPHIPLGAQFVNPMIGNEGEIFMGSATVLADGSPMSHMSLPAITCSDVGMPAPFRAKKKGAPKSLFLPTSVLTTIPGGPPVLVGGPPTIDMQGMIFKAKLAAAKGIGKKIGKWATNTNAWKKFANKAQDLGSRAFKKVAENARNLVARAKCAITGHPVDIATGKVFTEHVDFELPGPLPLKWERVWYSTSTYQGPLGHGWHHAYDLHLRWDPQMRKLILRTADGRNIVFPELTVGEEAHNRQERLTLKREPGGYCILDADQLAYRFHLPAPATPGLHRLACIASPAGHQVGFDYSAEGHLQNIADSAGRRLRVTCDLLGRILAIDAPHPEKPDALVTLVRYGYDTGGNLTEVRDALEQPFTYRYTNHLLVQETNRNGLSFYFQYDGPDANARCVRTWGDGGIYDHKLTYFLLEQYTVVENSLGYRTVHHWTDDGLVYHTVDALGNSTYKQFDEALQLVEETDQLGGSTRYAYDERGNRTAIVKPDGTAIGLYYDDNNQVVKLTNETGAVWQWTYDEQGQLTQRVDPAEAVTSYRYRDGLLAELIDAAGNSTRLEYDTFRNITGLITPDGERSQWRYDALGRCVEVLDPKGNAQRRLFDLLGQVQRVHEPDGNIRQLAYDGEGNVVHAKDQQHDVRFAYAGMGRMVAREEAATRVAFRYDTEEQLVAIQNEHGSVYQFELDARGDVAVERGFDGITRRYLRNAAGQVSRVERPANLFTEYAYDQAGRLTEVQHWDGTAEQYAYRADGELVSASNGNSSVRFERDVLGRVVQEIQDKGTVASVYDILGRRTAVTSSLGANLAFDRNGMGDVEKVSADGIHGSWEASFKRDALGLELERLLPGGVRNQWQRDRLGRPVAQRTVTAGGNVQRTRTYTWEVNDRLRQIQDSQLGVTKFEHDVFGNLTGAHYGDGQLDHRIADAVGNLFRWKNKQDRKYGPAGQLLEAEGTRYTYDVEGNLVQKTEPNRDIWRYEWNAAGMLAKVVRPDGREVTFTYDALGRRLTKIYQGKTTHWVWDGNVPLHEWTEKRVIAPVYANDDRIAEELQRQQELRLDTTSTGADSKDLTTWVFEPESFAPLAKLKNGQRYSIVTDHLGTPLGMFDAQGEQTWQMELSVYGEARNFRGGREDCPFRYPGQYEDVETGLYYNRFRYYDARGGMYVSQDPIKLKSGQPNLYAYVHNPSVFVDLLGLDCAKKILDDVGSLAGKKKADIQAILQKQGFTKTSAGNGGEIWTKAGSDGNTAAVRLDPAKIRSKPKGFADEVPHAHKEITPTSNVISGNYHGADTYDDFGNLSTNPRDTHISILE